MTATPATTPQRDFDDAWRESFDRHRDLTDLILTMIKMTDAGAYPVPLASVAAELGTPVAVVRGLFETVAPGGRAWVNAYQRDGHAHLELASSRPKPRFHYQIGERRIGVDGCAGDVFLLAYGLGRPFSVESACPATGTPIRIEFTASGLAAVQPAGTVIVMIHPDTAPEAFLLTDPDQVYADVCLQQPFYASANAAAGWLASHPGGQVIPVTDDFYRRWRGLVRRCG